jgi:transposase InsO family protein
VRRYERERPGELIHIDIKKLGKFNQIGHRITGDRTGQSNSRGVGWEYAHVCIDDHSRIAFADIMPNQKKRSATAFLRAAVAYYAKLGVKVERVMTDNGSCYRSFAFRRTCKRLGLRHIRTKPYTPKTNGKVERFIQSCLREWAYAYAYENSQQRKQQLPTWLHRYNWHRPHAGRPFRARSCQRCRNRPTLCANNDARFRHDRLNAADHDDFGTRRGLPAHGHLSVRHRRH